MVRFHQLPPSMTWKISHELRSKMIDRIFAAGYNGPDEGDKIRWSREEMHNLCNDWDLLSLFERYDSDYEDKFAVEREAKEQIAIYDWLI